MGDALSLERALVSLVDNAVKFSPDDGEVEVHLRRKGGQVAVSVTDQGIGIPAENLARIFEPHFTTKPPGEGTGLGLSIAYRIVEDHGGHFSVDSKVNEGSAFTVLIPVQPGGPVP
jgi:two-component system NtrC family sensor kinase